MEDFLVFILIGLLFFLAMLSYKHRVRIIRWLDDPDVLVARGNRVKILKRRIEDSQDEIAEIEAKEAKEKD